MIENLAVLCVIFGFCCSVSEICILLGIFAAWSGSLLQMFQDRLLVPSYR